MSTLSTLSLQIACTLNCKRHTERRRNVVLSTTYLPRKNLYVMFDSKCVDFQIHQLYWSHCSYKYSFWTLFKANFCHLNVIVGFD